MFNNDDLLQTHGPYGKHGKQRMSTKKWLTKTHYRIGVCTWSHGWEKKN